MRWKLIVYCDIFEHKISSAIKLNVLVAAQTTNQVI